VLSHSVLHLGQFALLGQRFHGIDFTARDDRQKHQATIDWAVSASGAVLPKHDHSAGPTFAFRATFFGPGQALCAQKVEERCVRTSLGPHTFPVQLKFNDRTGLAIH